MTKQDVAETREQAILRTLQNAFTQMAEEAAQARTNAEAELGRAVVAGDASSIDALTHKTKTAQALAQ